jgi:predicted phosphodiesterase
MVDVYMRLMKETAGKRPVVEGNQVWYPMRVGDFAEHHEIFGDDGRRLSTIIKYVYAPNRLCDRNFDTENAIEHAMELFKCKGNDWLIDKLRDYVKEKYDPYFVEWPPKELYGDLDIAEILALNEYHSGSKTTNKDDMNNMICNLIGYGILHTQRDWDSNYIFFGPVPSSEINSQNEKKAQVKSPEYKRFLWMDVGVWSQHNAVVGIVTPHEVAMYDIYDSQKGNATRCRSRVTEGTLADQVLKLLHRKLGRGRTVFYQDLKQIKPIKTPVLDNEVIFVIPDLHLHLFKGYIADNFRQPFSGRSLDEILEKVLSVITEWVDTGKTQVKIIQVGDMYELWESAMLLCIGLDSDLERENRLTKAFTLAMAAYSFGQSWLATHLRPPLVMPPPSLGGMRKYVESIEAVVRREKLDKILSKSELNKLRLPWTISKGDNIATNPAIKDVWKKMQRKIENLHQTLFKANTGKFRTWDNQAIIAGNHDSFLGHAYVIEYGLDDVIRFEHLHYNDPYNKPSNMEAGQFFTALQLIAETLGIGREAKALEKNRRSSFLRDAAKINWDRYCRGKPMYDLIITGHTHRAYAQVIKLKKSQKFYFEANDPLYDQGWLSDPNYRLAIELLKKHQCAFLGGMAALGKYFYVGIFMKLIFTGEPGRPFPI